jgi:hypothetical protein
VIIGGTVEVSERLISQVDELHSFAAEHLGETDDDAVPSRDAGRYSPIFEDAGTEEAIRGWERRDGGDRGRLEISIGEEEEINE